MTPLARISLANRMLVGLIALAIVVFGVLAVFSLKQELLPSTQVPAAFVTASYPGTSPQIVADEVSTPIEQAVLGVDGVTDVQSTSSNGVASITVQWEYGLDSDQVVSDLQNAIDSLAGTLPEDVDTTVLAGSTDDIPVLQLAVASDASFSEAGRLVDDVAVPALSEIEGVRSVTVTGQNTTEVAVSLRPRDLRRYDLTAQAVTETIRAQALVTPAGTGFDGNTELAVEVGRGLDSVKRVQGLWLPAPDGPVALSRVADVKLQSIESTSLARADGRPALSLTILKESDADAVEISHAVSDRLPDLERELGSGTRFSTVFDQAPLIEQSIDDLAVEGGLGLAFAVLVILVFLLSLRSTVITAISIPMSLLIAMIGLQVGGFSLNIFTLAALTVAVGRVVDDSIVVIENIKRRDTGGQALTPADIVASVREVAGAVTASTLTTVAVFLPVAFVSGVVGELFRPFAVTVAVALAASLLVSMTIVPVLAFWFLRGRRRRRAAAAGGDHDRVTRLQRGYLPVLGWGLRHPGVTVVAAALVFAGTMGSATLLKTDFLGAVSDETALQIDQELPPGTRLAATSKAAEKVEQVLADTPQVETYLTTITGGGGNGFDGSAGGAANRAAITVKLAEGSDGNAVQEELQRRLDELEGAGTLVVAPQDNGGANTDVSVTVSGDDAATLRAGAQQVEQTLTGIAGLTEVSSNLAEQREVLKVDVDQRLAADQGFTQSEVGQAIAGSLRGTQVGSVTLEGEQRDITVRVQASRARPADIANLELPVSQLQQQRAQTEASDELADKQQASSDRAQREADQAVAEQETELREQREEAEDSLSDLRDQLSQLRDSPPPPPDPSAPPIPVSQQVLAQQQYAEQLAQLEAAVEQAEGGIEQIDEQLEATAEQASSTAEQRAEAEELADEQEGLADVRATPIRVRDVAKVATQLAPTTVTQIDGTPSVTITATPDTADLGALTQTITAQIDALDLPPGVSATIGGASQDQQEAFNQLGLAMLLAILLVFVIMVATFRSLVQPLILLVSVPFAATGAVAGLLLTDTPLGVPAMVGLLMLIGIVVTNAIVLIDLINQYRAAGKDLHSAVVDGARLRLRPIIMTASATIFALIPMGLGLTGGGAFISRPLAIVVIGGLVSSTVLTLLLVPVLYTLVERRGERRRRQAEPPETAPTPAA